MQVLDTYATFTQRLRAQQRAAYASLTLAQEQRRLRIHLRRILLLHRPSSLTETATAEPTPFEARHWRQEAIAREQQRARRDASARILQRLVRSWLAARTDVELPAESEWVALPRPPPARRVVATHDSELPPTPVALTQPFQVIIELLGARDLALGSHNEIVVDVRLVNPGSNAALGRLEAVAAASPNEEIVWNDHVLQLGVDAPERALGESAVDAELFAARSSLGRLRVALDLLETPLARQYAMTRWFPLERGRGPNAARHVKGEVRLSIRLLMRNPKARGNDDDVWVPYSGPTPEAPASVAPSKPPLSPRKRPVASPRPPVRRARVEAMSPPSSPSSYSSDSNAEFSPPRARALSSPQLRSPSPSRRRLSSGSGVVTRRQSAMARDREAEVSPPEENESVESPPKPVFLKRKPYKVVFHKLDWSRVSAKTDSNWGTTGTPSGPTKPPSVMSPKAMTASVASPMKDRLETVTQQVLGACHFTKATAPLASMRFRTERKRWLSAVTNGASDQSDETLQTLWTELHDDTDGTKYAAWLKAETEMSEASTCT